MSLDDRHADEILTDNSAENWFSQCKNCIYNNDGTIHGNKYDKGYCVKYPYGTPGKTHGIYTGEEKCIYRKER